MNRGNMTGVLPRWAFLVVAVLMMVYQGIYYPALNTLVLTSLAVTAFFVLDFFIPRIVEWWKKRKTT